MKVFVQGELIPEDQAFVSIFDRGFLYGDGVFETIRLHQGRSIHWNQHWSRLEQGAKFLQIALPFPSIDLQRAASELALQNSLPESIARLTLSRGRGQRGFSPQGAESPFMCMVLFPAPLQPPGSLRWKIMTTGIRLPAEDPLAPFKTCNKLPNILAKREAEAARCDDGLLLTPNGSVAEASGSNLFWIQNGTLFTPPLRSGCLPGITRHRVISCCAKMGIACQEALVTSRDLRLANALFLTLSSFGIVLVSTLDGHSYDTSMPPLLEIIVQELRREE